MESGREGDREAAGIRLSRDEAEPLWRRERMAFRLAGMGLTVFAALLAWRFAFGDVGALGMIALAGAVLLVVAAVLLPALARCPRCGASLGRQSLAMLPDRCISCGASIPRPDILDAELDN